MKTILLLLLSVCLLCLVQADELTFWQDLGKTYTTNVATDDTTGKPPISRMRKLFYDGTKWDMVIPDAEGYQKPQDAVSLDFQKKYAGSVVLSGACEDFKHMLAGLDSYLHPSSVGLRVAQMDEIPEQERGSLMNYDMCSWLGDIASALAESEKQSLPLEKAFANYAGYEDLKANIAAFHIGKLAQPFLKETYKFPIVEICQKHYQGWHNMAERQQFLLAYFTSFGLVIEQNQQGQWKFTDASRKQFFSEYTGKLKLVAYAYYMSGSRERFIFTDAKCVATLTLFLNELEKFYAFYAPAGK